MNKKALIKAQYRVLISEQELLLQNLQTLSDNCIPYDDFINICVDCQVIDKIEVVKFPSPSSSNQNEIHGVFKEVWIYQWATNIDRDAFEGFIYGRFEKNKWLKIPYIG